MKKQLLVYVHVPFCTSKCHFCDWVQEIPVPELRLQTGSGPRARYLDALARQIEFWGERLTAEGYVPSILYWGGGTASILTLDEIRQVMGSLEAHFSLAELEEATIECSPETLSAEKLALFRRCGFRRISIGLQSMNDGRLRRIGRSHDSHTGSASVRLARDGGFQEINIDLISGFPGETLEEFESSLRAALELPVTHVSLYPYRPAAGTVMRRFGGSPAIGRIDQHQQLAAYELGRTLLEEAGLPEYAVSHFGHQPCLSDLAYFQLRMDWIGFGSGATSLLQGEFLATARGQLHRFSANPLEFDQVMPAASPKITPRLIYQSLSTWEGAEARYWNERTTLSLDEILAQPEVGSLLEQLGRGAGMVRDAAGVRLAPGQAAAAFIRLLYQSAPREARAWDRPESVLGAY